MRESFTCRRRSLLSVLAISAFAVGCAEEPVAEEIVRPVRAIRVGSTVGQPTPEYTGQAEASEEVNLSFRVAGPLESRQADVGDRFEAGAEVARIDPQDFEVHLRNVEGQLVSARADLALAEDEYARAQGAYERDAVSDIELTRYREARNAALGNEATLQASVQSAKDDLEYSSLKAPFDGLITATYVENFEYVQARQPVLRMVDISTIELWIDVPEQFIANAPFVRNISVEFDAFPGQRVPATIGELGSEASRMTRTYPVSLVMEQPEGFTILPGMAGTAQGEIVVPGSEDVAFEIPMSALGERGEEGTFVWVFDPGEGRVARRTVETVRLTPRGVIVGGITPGEWVVTAGVYSLEEGQQVRLLDGADGDGAVQP